MRISASQIQLLPGTRLPCCAILSCMADLVATCPFHPFSAEYLDDPYPRFAAAREQTSAFYSDELDMWVVTRYAKAAMVMPDIELFSVSHSQDPLLPGGGQGARPGIRLRPGHEEFARGGTAQ